MSNTEPKIIMDIKWVAFISIFVTNLNNCLCSKYDHYRLYNVFIKSREDIICLKNLGNEKYINVDFWTKPFKINSTVQVMVSPEDERLFLERIDHFSLTVELLIPNLQE